MKTPLDMLALLYQHLAPSPLSEAITGQVCQLNRPANSLLEDVVLNALPIDSSQVQQGVANVNIYVPDLTGGPDLGRLEGLTQLAGDLLVGIYTQGYTLDIVRQALVAEPETQSHYANLRVAFQFFPSH